MDIKSAFLQSKPIEREVLLKPPKEVSINKVWKLYTTVWYLSVKEELINRGGVKSRHDDVIFFWDNNQLLQGILLSHMDNFFGQELSGFKRILLTILERNLPLVKRKHKHLDIYV